MSEDICRLSLPVWSLGFTLDDAAPDGYLITLGEAVRIEKKDGAVIAIISTFWHNNYLNEDHEFTFTLTAPGTSGEFLLVWLGYAVRLYISGALVDEDWPLGQTVPETAPLVCAPCVRNAVFTENPVLPEDTETSFTGPMQFFTPPGHNTRVGDCMPFARDGRYCLYYLLDRRGHRSKAGLGAHQWAQISSADLKTWTIHPMAVPITAQWEGSICTGSLIQKDGRTYAFYAVRTSDRSPALLTWAESEDGVHFVKSGKTFSLASPYEPVSARDPMVFFGADEQYHMLVTTNLVGPDAPDYPGCLAHLVSTDLQNWTQCEPFIVPGYTDQPECSDYFEWNGWYYLVFANFAVARYRMSRKPFGPWIKPENDVLDTREGQVAKTAAFGTRRFSSSFLTTYPRTYAGYAVTHELFQRADGTLGTRFVPEILPTATALLFSADRVTVDACEGRQTVELGRANHLRLRAILLPSSRAMRFGVELIDREDKRYHIDIQAAQGRVSLSRPGQDFSMGDMRNQLLGVWGLDKPFALDLIVWEEALDLQIGSDRVITMRAPRAEDLIVRLYAMNGRLEATDVTLETL